ncbi:MAG: hypothetical protein HQ567_16030, partial [Candidatus Nealsonbacteria bacterium]|nr:hypothetical protein [Candidatus Nealsonbacteria bacterium]
NISKAKSLTFLSMEKALIKGQGFSALRKLPHLRKLTITHSHITALPASGLDWSSTNLEFLSLSNNQLTGAFLDNFSPPKSLFLGLFNNVIDDEAAERFRAREPHVQLMYKD